ncbi:hypothetical protein [Phaeacidiphilus oryzae]|uniref:hypothetical protein n=1 Tax=Phaeacidiphilus oryzae TaxID=348818 RepID=UPI0006892504|nr:hypothetical protein [Phaeacidiphilus oryzae]
MSQPIDRGSSKHGPALDDEMARETEGLVRSGRHTRAEEWHDPEPPDDEEDAESAEGAPLAGSEESDEDEGAGPG